MPKNIFKGRQQMVVNCTVTHSQHFANMEEKTYFAYMEKAGIFLIWEKPTCVKSN